MIILHFLDKDHEMNTDYAFILWCILYNAFQICQVVSIIIKLPNLDSNNEMQKLELHF
jgi:hypothetical protein